MCIRVAGCLNRVNGHGVLAPDTGAGRTCSEAALDATDGSDCPHTGDLGFSMDLSGAKYTRVYVWNKRCYYLHCITFVPIARALLNIRPACD